MIILVLGLRHPGARIAGVPKDAFFWRVIALTLVYSAYVSEVYRAGIDSVHSSQAAAARSLGLSQVQTLRYVVVPQAVRRVIPPLLNDFIGLQKDTVLVSFIGVVEIFRAGPDHLAATFNFTPYLAIALVFLVVTIPLARFTDWLVARERRSGRPVQGRHASVPDADGSGTRGSAEAASDRARPRIEGLHKSFGELEVLRGHRPRGRRARGRRLIGASGTGKSTLLRCINLLEPIDAGRIVVEGEEITAQGVDVDRVRRRIGIVFQAFNLFPHMSVLDNVTLAPRKVLGLSRAEAERDALELLARFGLADKARRVPGPAVGRPAAARGDRPGARDGARPAAARRDHPRPRPGARRRGAGRDPRAGRGRA